MEKKNYEALIPNRIFVGGVDGVEPLLANEHIDVIFDLRVSSNNHPAEDLKVHQPILDGQNQQDDSIRAAVHEVVQAYNEGKNIYFHCTSGGGRAGTMAVATLMELNLAETVEEAEENAKAIRSKINLKEDQRESLKRIYSK
ncbi:dual specificity protein phosphatase family protein [Psychrobacillus sp. INOP01]|uniref:protein-tyrosine phosphatase family protein n=1 Tax=Psychrobacillus sp. INOP01 TaxID=2829187 RepID=UPI001BA65263|nr:dual specificity protein phosphatase family protein [Psychrobacillus sp. INOP01]QUG43552.1 dual specificity protein phosphatase family protein [Psychrobacillus sp. INOP01]